MYVILLPQFYRYLTSAISIGDFYRGCGVCLLAVILLSLGDAQLS